MITLAEYFALAQAGSGPPSAWPPPPREPLPPFPSPTETQPPPPDASCWTHDAFATALPFTPPSTPTIDFHRGNFCGLRVPGAPYVPGCTEQDTSLIFTWFLYEYPRDWQERILDAYQACGYTHIDFHRADWLGLVDGVPGCDKSVALDLVRRCRDRGLTVIVNLAINATPDPNELKPWIDDLVGAGMAIGCIAWQINQLLLWPDIFDYIDWVCPYIHQQGVKTSVQWSLDACAVWPSEKYHVYSRFDFQRWTADKIDYIYQQYDTESPLLDERPHAGGILGEANDVLWSIAGLPQKLVACEYDAQAEFNDPHARPERYGDLKGRCLLTAASHGRVMDGGYLNGARKPDGGVL
jgi:hypothetical protein